MVKDRACNKNKYREITHTWHNDKRERKWWLENHKSMKDTGHLNGALYGE